MNTLEDCPVCWSHLPCKPCKASGVIVQNVVVSMYPKLRSEPRLTTCPVCCGTRIFHDVAQHAVKEREP